MKSTVENLEPTKAKVTVTVGYEELEPFMAEAYKDIATQVNIPGFRKGHVPPRIIDQRFGRGAVLEHAINEGLPGFYSDAVREHELRPLAQPTVEVTKVPDPSETEGELHFTAEVEVRPTLDLPELSTLNITVDDVVGFKQAADRAARALSSEPDRATQDALVARLLAGRS